MIIPSKKRHVSPLGKKSLFNPCGSSDTQQESSTLIPGSMAHSVGTSLEVGYILQKDPGLVWAPINFAAETTDDDDETREIAATAEEEKGKENFILLAKHLIWLSMITLNLWIMQRKRFCERNRSRSNNETNDEITSVLRLRKLTPQQQNVNDSQSISYQK